MASESAPIIGLIDFALAHPDKSSPEQRATLVLHHRQHALARRAQINYLILDIPRLVNEEDRDYEYDELIGDEL